MRLLGDDNNERPANVFSPSWLNGKPNCVDLTIRLDGITEYSITSVIDEQ
jgi:hypothetical protein